MSFSSDGSRVLSGGWDNTMKLWDTATGALIRTFAGHSNHVTSVSFSPDGSRVLSLMARSASGGWRSGERLVSLIGGHEGEWLAILPEGFFAGSPNGAKLLSVVRGLEVLSIDQFYQVLYRPISSGRSLPVTQMAKSERPPPKLDHQKLLDSGPVRKVAIISPRHIGERSHYVSGDRSNWASSFG